MSWGWYLLIALVLIGIIVFLRRKQGSVESSLDSIKSGWGKCCAKIGGKFGV